MCRLHNYLKKNDDYLFEKKKNVRELTNCDNWPNNLGC